MLFRWVRSGLLALGRLLNDKAEVAVKRARWGSSLVGLDTPRDLATTKHTSLRAKLFTPYMSHVLQSISHVDEPSSYNTCDTTIKSLFYTRYTDSPTTAEFKSSNRGVAEFTIQKQGQEKKTHSQMDGNDKQARTPIEGGA